MVEGAARPIDRNGIVLFAIPMAVTTILGFVGDAFAPTLLGTAPLVLIICNPRLRNLVLAAPLLGPVPFIGVAVARLVITDPFFYWFGRRYGDVAIRWMEQKLGAGATVVLWFERFFARTSYAAVAVLPNQWICLLAGATRMRVWAFIVLNIGGTITRVVAVWILGDVFADPLLAVNDWIGAHRLQLTLLTMGLVSIGVWRSARKGTNTIETPSELAEELAAAEREDTSRVPDASDGVGGEEK